MSAMDQMLTNMLKGLIPAEVLEMITPEKLQEFGNQINAFINKQNEFQIEVIQRLERLENERGTNSGSSRRDSGNDS